MDRLLDTLGHASTPNGRLFVYSVIGDTPMLSYTLLGQGNRQSPVFSPPKPVFVILRKDGQDFLLKSGADDVFGVYCYKTTNSISRISVDTKQSRVRVSYPFVDDRGRTAQALLTVIVEDDYHEPVITPLALVQASQNHRSILQATFVESDAESARDQHVNDAMFYWIEGNDPDLAHNSKPKEQSSLGIVLHEFSVTSQPIILNTSNGREQPTPLISAGHYAYAGSYRMGNTLYFLSHWAEASGIKANLVKVPIQAQ
jgi:hypothetical protein